MNRECDPDLCGGCGVHLVLDPVNRYDDAIQKNHCQNAPIQLGVPKRTLLGDSRVHGFGLYAGEPIKENEFVGEYTGEIITKEETERRGVIYREQNRSYLFNLNRDQEIDSQRLGNKIRFINHAAKTSSLRNLAPKIFLCNMVQRIGMFAIKDIAVGKELFFDYGKDYHETLIDGSKKEKKSGKVVSKTHNQSLINDFIEPESALDIGEDEDDEDEDDRPLKRVRANRLQSENRPKPKIHLKAAKKSQDQSPKLHLRKTNAAIKTAPTAIPTQVRVQDVFDILPSDTVAAGEDSDGLAGASPDDGSDFEMKDVEEESASEEEEDDLEPRRSHRVRKKSWKIRRTET